MKKLCSFLTVLGLLLFCSSSFASVGIVENGGAAIGQAGNLSLPCDPVSSITVDGFTYNVGCNTNFVMAGISNGGETSMTSTTIVVPTSFSLVKFDAQNDSAYQTITMPAGVPGQVLTAMCMGGSQTGTVSSTWEPATGVNSMNFSKIKFTAKGDTAVFLYVNNTLGWELMSYDSLIGTTITVTLTAT